MTHGSAANVRVCARHHDDLQPSSPPRRRRPNEKKHGRRPRRAHTRASSSKNWAASCHRCANGILDAPEERGDVWACSEFETDLRYIVVPTPGRLCGRRHDDGRRSDDEDETAEVREAKTHDEKNRQRAESRRCVRHRDDSQPHSRPDGRGRTKEAGRTAVCVYPQTGSCLRLPDLNDLSSQRPRDSQECAPGGAERRQRVLSPHEWKTALIRRARGSPPSGRRALLAKCRAFEGVPGHKAQALLAPRKARTMRSSKTKSARKYRKFRNTE